MIFNNEEKFDEFHELISDSGIGKTLYFDHESKSFPIVDGSPVVVGNLDSLAEFVKAVVHIEAGAKAIYDSDFGTNLRDMVGKKKNGFEVSQFFQKVSDSVKKLDAVESVGDFRFTDGVISFSVKLRTGETLEETISLVGDY